MRFLTIHQRILVSLMLIIVLSGMTASGQDVAVQDPVTYALCDWLQHQPFPPRITVGGERLASSWDVMRFYASRGYRPAWWDARGLRVHALHLLQALQSSDRHGLRPDDYHLVKLARLIKRLRYDVPIHVNPVKAAGAELLLTDAFITLGRHLAEGRVDPAVNGLVAGQRTAPDLVVALETALAGGRIQEGLEDLAPDAEPYRHLQDALRRYRDMADHMEWPSMVVETPMRPGPCPVEAMVLLRFKLRALGELTGELPLDEAVYDDSVTEAVKSYQARMGLPVCGEVDEATLESLNAPLERRIRTLEINLERWRWLKPDLGQRYVMVNIPDFRLRVVEGPETVLEMRVVVGQVYRKTPLFAETMRYMILNPTWEIPPNLVVGDKLNRIRNEQQDYFSRNGITVLQGWGENAREIDPRTVDWKHVPVEDFYRKYRLRMAPGPDNPLGRIKFMFPNDYNVYFHGTPSHELFERDTRDFSSGCIRMEDPVAMAAYVLKGHRLWSRTRIQAALETNVEQKIRLPKPIPVYILYWTAWCDPEGQIQFRRDIYGLDEALDQALRNPPEDALPNVPQP